MFQCKRPICTRRILQEPLQLGFANELKCLLQHSHAMHTGLANIVVDLSNLGIIGWTSWMQWQWEHYGNIYWLQLCDLIIDFLLAHIRSGRVALQLVSMDVRTLENADYSHNKGKECSSSFSYFRCCCIKSPDRHYPEISNGCISRVGRFDCPWLSLTRTLAISHLRWNKLEDCMSFFFILCSLFLFRLCSSGEFKLFARDNLEFSSAFHYRSCLYQDERRQHELVHSKQLHSNSLQSRPTRVSRLHLLHWFSW